ncbi:HAD-IB family phosphatase [Leeia sp. TBRC 13508]|uniref:HAD-IB family phosphatase n=1 Tax=Leeia speluncae TaxID=2884804 RepID=A0ABS8D6Z7_9NEIS|nr:HAD-IB family phosphatase [Leeia speluncae]MCB6183951.1 HAD-IB family phosphatase [Leeia speluncae]
MLATVVIPALNEELRIAEVVQFATASKLVGEVLVIDDGSTDATAIRAKENGAYVITSSLLGKGASMADGLAHAHFDLILYLDGDLAGLKDGLIEQLLYPLLIGSADFVKAAFGRAGGRVTELTAKPLIRTFFPELAHYKQPLGGIIAARRSVLETLKFEDDYGVDVGLLLDASLKNVKIAEVEIGRIEHDSQSLENLSRMADQVSRTIFRYAQEAGRFTQEQVSEVVESERHLEAEIDRAAIASSKHPKIAIFDMDGTLTSGRFVQHLAAKCGKAEELASLLDHSDLDSITRSNSIARLFRGVPKQIFLEVAKEIPLNRHAIETIKILRQNGYTVGVVSDSYYIATETLRKRVFADFALGHLLQFRNDICTGGLRLNPVFEMDSGGCGKHKHCKSNVLRQLAELRHQPFENQIAIGDNLNDLCMLEMADVGFAYDPKHDSLREAPIQVIHDLYTIVSHLDLNTDIHATGEA